MAAQPRDDLAPPAPADYPPVVNPHDGHLSTHVPFVPEDALRRIPALLGHCLILLAALRDSHSTSGFLLNGPAVALLVDRYLLRLLPWASPVRWRSELAARGAYFIVGAVVFYLLRPGIVPWWEAVYRGALASVAAFVVESCVGLVSRSPRGWRDGLWVRLTSLGLLILAIPEAAALHPLHTVPKRTPAALGLAFEEVRFQTADGLRLAGWLVPHAGARGNVIFCHGHGRNRGHVAALLPTLHGMGLNVLSFDFRGHGESEGHTSTFGCREVDDLLAAESYLRGRCPGQPLFLVGTSLGAAVAIQALPRMPDVRGVWSEARLPSWTSRWRMSFCAAPLVAAAAGCRLPLGRLARLRDLGAGNKPG